MTTWFEQTVKELGAAHPAWQVWYVPTWDGRRSGTTWCARLWDDHKTVLNEDSPEHLAEAIEAHPAPRSAGT